MKKIILSALMLTGMLTFAQDGKLSISGSVDVYGTANSTDGGGTPGILSDVAAKGFGLGMANTVFAYEDDKSGFVADLSFGPRANAANMYQLNRGQQIAGAVNQLYVYYNLNETTTVTAGQFNTFYGYEVISPVANFNYSVSYLFNAGPFSHTGVKVDYAASEDLSLMLALTNPHGLFNGTNASDKLQLGGQVGYKGQYLNFVYGSVDGTTSDELLVDFTGGFDLADDLYLGINGAFWVDNYQGVALYLEKAVNDSLSIGFRPEYFDTDASGGDSGIAATFSANKSLTDNFKTILELRYDQAEIAGTDDDVFALTLAGVYSF